MEHFTVLVPAYNCEAWVENNLNAILNQKYENYSVIYIDDASTDHTAAKAEEVLVESKVDYNFLLNSFNRGKAYNLYYYINEMVRDDSIVVIVDGDDWLCDENVLSYLNEQYHDNTWMTCGSYITTDTKSLVTPRINKDYWLGNIRQKSWEFSHLGSFRKSLFSKIKKKDFMDKQGNYLSTTSDQAMMWPMAEMSGPEHFRVVYKNLYVYNRSNPLSDDRAHRRDQLRTEQDIRSRAPYSALESIQ